MRLIWHLVAKDLRSQRSLLWLWLALLMSKYAIGCALIWTDGTAPLGRFELLAEAARWLQHLERAGAVLAAALILEDPLVGERVFWRTRPIAGRRLLAAKALVLGLVFLALPVLVGLPWWLLCDYRVNQPPSAVWDVVCFHGPVALVAWFVAAVSRSLPHAFGNGVVAFVLAIGAVVLMAGVMGPSSMNQSLSQDPPLMLPGWVAWLVALGGGGALISHQYLRGHRPAAIACAVLLVALSSVGLSLSAMTSSMAKLRAVYRRAEDLPTVATSESIPGSGVAPMGASPAGFRVRAAQIDCYFTSLDPRRSSDSTSNPWEADFYARRSVLEIEVDRPRPLEWVEFVGGNLEWTLPDGTVERCDLSASDKPVTASVAARRTEDARLAGGPPTSDRILAVGQFPGRKAAQKVLPISARWQATLRDLLLVCPDAALPSSSVWQQGRRVAGWSQAANRARLLTVRRRPAPDVDDRYEGPLMADSPFRLALPSGTLLAPSRRWLSARIGTVVVSWEETSFAAPPAVAPGKAVALYEARLVEPRIEEVTTFVAEGPVTTIRDRSLPEIE